MSQEELFKANEQAAPLGRCIAVCSYWGIVLLSLQDCRLSHLSQFQMSQIQFSYNSLRLEQRLGIVDGGLSDLLDLSFIYRITKNNVLHDKKLF